MSSICTKKVMEKNLTVFFVCLRVLGVYGTGQSSESRVRCFLGKDQSEKKRQSIVN